MGFSLIPGQTSQLLFGNVTGENFWPSNIPRKCADSLPQKIAFRFAWHKLNRVPIHFSAPFV